MAKPDFTLEFIKEQSRLIKLAKTLIQIPAFALDIETIDWWNRHQERIALIQIAFRYNGQPKVAVIDALAGFSLEPLRAPLEHSSILKIIHNAAFDATRLSKHYNFNIAPITDTMLAARRSGERKYSLQAQSSIHLNIAIDKSTRNSDWSRRPLDNHQLSYAALDCYTTLLLYENQTSRNLNGNYRLKTAIESSHQIKLPLNDSSIDKPVKPRLYSNLHLEETIKEEVTAAPLSLPKSELDSVAVSILGIVAELPSRYSPDQLSVSLGTDRVGLAGWIVDNNIGRDAELDEETVKISIANLCECSLLRITETRRLEATHAGSRIWEQLKSN
jgi:hypothetical protein